MASNYLGRHSQQLEKASWQIGCSVGYCHSCRLVQHGHSCLSGSRKSENAPSSGRIRESSRRQGYGGLVHFGHLNAIEDPLVLKDVSAEADIQSHVQSINSSISEVGSRFGKKSRRYYLKLVRSYRQRTRGTPCSKFACGARVQSFVEKGPKLMNCHRHSPRFDYFAVNGFEKSILPSEKYNQLWGRAPGKARYKNSIASDF